jgi:cell wall-associated NlpC family hydrolase
LAVLALASAPAASAAGTGGGAATAAHGTGASGATTTSSLTAASSPTATSTSGGAGIGAQPALPFPRPTVPGFTAEIIHGVAYAPANAPLAVQEAIWAGDRIRLKPYRVGGGHGTWNDTAYDCSGSVSYVLHAAGLLKISEDSGEMMSWGQHGAGQWITVYTNPGHAFVEVAGIRLDTSAEQDPNPPSGTGPRWRPLMTSTAGYMARHPLGF